MYDDNRKEYSFGPEEEKMKTVAAQLAGGSRIAREQTAIASVVDAQDAKLIAIATAIDLLYEKFAPVLAEGVPIPSDDQDSTETLYGNSALFYRLREQTYRADSIFARLNTLRYLAEV